MVDEPVGIGEQTLAIIRSDRPQSRSGLWMARVVVYGWMLGWPAVAIWLIVT